MGLQRHGLSRIQDLILVTGLLALSQPAWALPPRQIPQPGFEPYRVELPKTGALVPAPPDLYFLPRSEAEVVTADDVRRAVIPRRLSLDVAERFLLEHNTAILNARHQVAAALQGRVVASKRPNPQLTVGAEGLNAGTFTSPPATQTFTVRYDQLYERGGQRRHRTWQAAANAYSAEAALSDTIRTQLLALRTAFTAGVLARENLRLAVEVLEQYLKTESLTSIKVEAGELAGLDLYRVRSGRLQFQQAILQAETQYANATRDVLNALGKTADDVEPSTVPETQLPATAFSEPAAMLTSAPVTAFAAKVGGAPLELNGAFDTRTVETPLAELRRVAIATRPDVIAARYAVEAARHAYLGFRTQRTNDINVGTEFQRLINFTDTGAPPTLRIADNVVGVIFSTSIFTNNDHKAEIKQGESLLRAAVAQLRTAELTAVRDVESAYQSYKLARRIFDLYNKENLAQLQKMQQIASFSYKNGAATLFELLDAQRTYRQALAAYNQSRSDYQTSLFQLEAAIGRPIFPAGH